MILFAIPTYEREKGANALSHNENFLKVLR
jgi:hypothetical protein